MPTAMKIYVQKSLYFLLFWTRHDIFNTNVHKHRKKKQMNTFTWKSGIFIINFFCKILWFYNLIFERSVIVVENPKNMIILLLVQLFKVSLFFSIESFKALNCFHPINIHLHKIWKICMNLFNWTKCKMWWTDC